MQNLDFIYVDSKKGFSSFLNCLQENHIEEIAIDFEMECNRHHYGNHICLIQVFAEGKTFLIDALAISASRLRVFLENKKIVKTGFAMNSDIKLVMDCLNIKMAPVYDISLISRTLNNNMDVSLDKLLARYLNVMISDKKAFQLNDWMARPVSPEALNYAAGDVKYLFELREKLIEDAVQQNKIGQVLAAMATKEWNYDRNTEPSFFSKVEFLQLNMADQKLCREAFAVREKFAALLDKPATDIFDHQSLFYLVRKKSVDAIRFYNKVLSAEMKEKLIKNLQELLLCINS